MLRAFVIYVALITLSIFLQGTLLPAVNPNFIVPDLLLILVLIVGLYFRSMGGLFSALLIGLVSDFAAAKYMGPEAAGSIAAFWVVIYISQKVYIEHFFGLMILGFIASFIDQLIYIGMVATYSAFETGYGKLFSVLLWQAFFTGLLTPLVAYLVHFLDSKTRPFFTEKSRSLRSY
ncbi:MAG: hypothetical protein IT292_10995 [Deltaproteobacteria bacterium]|nr:hypothetical protein [Deltaproteobacteria bacterium]